MKRSNIMRIGLWLALIATLLAAWFAPENNEIALGERVKNSESLPVVIATDATLKKTTNTAQSRNASEKVLRIQKRKAQDDEAVSLFALSEWQHIKNIRLPVNEPEVVAPSPLPTAPPLPFKVMGRYIEDGKITVFLLHSDRTLIAREGETLASSYKVERIDATAVHLRYLPLDIPQVLEAGSAL